MDVDKVMQDNKSATLLEKNGKKSSGKRIQVLKCKKGNLKMMHCPTDKMITDFMTKGSSGEKFAKFGKEVMGCTKCSGTMKGTTAVCKA